MPPIGFLDVALRKMNRSSHIPAFILWSLSRCAFQKKVTSSFTERLLNRRLVTFSVIGLNLDFCQYVPHWRRTDLKIDLRKLIPISSILSRSLKILCTVICISIVCITLSIILQPVWNGVKAERASASSSQRVRKSQEPKDLGRDLHWTVTITEVNSFWI